MSERTYAYAFIVGKTAVEVNKVLCSTLDKPNATLSGPEGETREQILERVNFVLDFYSKQFPEEQS